MEDSDRCTCGATACESGLCDCDSVPCPVDHEADEENIRLRAELAAHRVAKASATLNARLSPTDVPQWEYDALLLRHEEVIRRAEQDRSRMRAENARLRATCAEMTEDRDRLIASVYGQG